jgi:sigma-B regulation protein RsbU (phosphoserine phosphatase)
MRILVAEDDTDTRELVALMLEKAGHDVKPQSDGIKAWEAFRQSPYQLLVTDCMMPGMDGFELCRKVRDANRRYTYIILLTAYGGRQNYMKGMEAGADDFLTKPCDFDELTARLRVAERILGLQQEVRQLTGLLPICAYCKKIRQAETEWVSVEAFVSRRSDASFSHTVCPTCFDAQLRPELDRVKR